MLQDGRCLLAREHGEETTKLATVVLSATVAVFDLRYSARTDDR